MSFEINRNVPANLLSKPLSEDQSLYARKAVNDLAKHIDVKAEGSRYPGRLRVHNLSAALKGDAQSIEIKRAGFFKNIFTSTNHVQRSSGYLRSLLGAAYKGKVSEEKYNDIMARVDKHLNKNLGFDGFGSRHFAKFVREFESAPQIFKNAPGSQYFDAETSTLLNSRAIKSNGPNAKTWGQAFVDIKTGLISLASDEHVNPLAQGAEGAVFELKINNTDKVIKINTFNAPDAGVGFRKGDIAAALVRKNMAHVISPTQYLINVRKEGGESIIYAVKPNLLKNFILENKKISLATGVPIEMTLHGTEMNKASGQSLRSLTKPGGLNNQDFGRFAAGLFLGIGELGANRLVHHDIKPDNVLYDRDTGATRLIGLGGLVKLSNKKDEFRQTTERMGSPPFQAPAALQGQPHGVEVDRFSYAMTLLCALEPNISSPKTIHNLSSYFGGNTRVVDENGQAKKFAAADYMAEYVRALNATTPENNGAAALEAKLEANPQFKRLIEQSFMASAGGAEGDHAWSVVHAECLPAVGPTIADIGGLNAMLKLQYADVNNQKLTAIFLELAREKNFNFKLTDFDIPKLSGKISSLITQQSRVDGVLNSKVVGHQEIQHEVKNLVSDFIDSKVKFFSDLDLATTDDDLKAVVKEQILLHDDFKPEQFKTLVESGLKIRNVMNSFLTSGGRQGFVDLIQFQRELGARLDGGDFRDSLLATSLQFCQKKGIDLIAVLTAMGSADSRDFYSSFLSGENNVLNPFTESLGATLENDDLIGLTQSMATEFNFLKSVALNAQNIMGINDFEGLNDIVCPNEISPADRSFILQHIYPDIAQ